MEIFDFLKKKTASKPATNSSGEALDRLTAEGELPWGWLAHNKSFVDKINGEYTYFLNNWLSTCNQEPLKQFEALKSFVLYMEDVEGLCKTKGECFVFWFEEILTGKGYLDKRWKELENLQNNFRQIEADYKQKQTEDAERARKVIEMRGSVIQR